MIEILSRNSDWFLLMVLAISFILAVIVFSKEAKLLFSNKQLIYLIASIPLIEFFLMWFSNSLYKKNDHSSYILLIISSLITSFIFGLMTKLILQIFNNEKIGFIRAFSCIKNWIIRTVLIFYIGFGGQLLVFEVLPEFERPHKIFLCMIWGIFTFALYPLLIAEEGNLFSALWRTFRITFQTIHKWFYLYLIVIFVSGEFLQLFSSSSVRVSWTGGYSFQPIWFDFFLKNAQISPAIITCVYIASILIASLTAVLVKIKLTKILFDSGFIRPNLTNSQ